MRVTAEPLPSSCFARRVGVVPRATTEVVARSLTAAPTPRRAKRGVVEAVGVEPTSERPVAAELYMLIRPWYFAIGNKERRMRRPLAQMSLVHNDAGRVSGPAD